jgi:hypothetical protein
MQVATYFWTEMMSKVLVEFSDFNGSGFSDKQ